MTVLVIGLSQLKEKTGLIPSEKIQKIIVPDEILTYVSRWPIAINILAAIFCMGCSTIFHLFHIHSKSVLTVLSRLDYGGISVLILGSTYPVTFYSFACQKSFVVRNIFLAIVTVTCTISFVITLLPSFDRPKYRPFRGYMYIILGLSAAIPLIYLERNLDTNKSVLPISVFA